MRGARRYKLMRPDLIMLAALVAANGLLLTPAGSPPRVAGALILFLLPGLAWIKQLLPSLDRLTRWIIGAGLGYTIAVVLGLILHYVPGPVSPWTELVALNALALIPILLARESSADQEGLRIGKAARWLAAILLLALAIRFASLGYSEFQGDEALAMITAAEALEGHQDAFFLRGKGPGEALLPMVLWRLTGTINETIARLPFTLAGLLMVPTVYLLGYRLFSAESVSSQKVGANLGVRPRGRHPGLPVPRIIEKIRIHRGLGVAGCWGCQFPLIEEGK